MDGLESGSNPDYDRQRCSTRSTYHRKSFPF
jgi:hypothetical protein